MKKLKLSPEFIGFLQGAVTIFYIILMGMTLGNAEKIFGSGKTILIPIIFLVTFIFSAIFTASTMLGYPFYVFWEKKDLKTAIKIVVSAAITLFIFILVSLLILVLRI